MKPIVVQNVVHLVVAYRGSAFFAFVGYVFDYVLYYADLADLAVHLVSPYLFDLSTV